MKNYFTNLRVIEISTALAGPYCAQMLGDMGADVIKVENPKNSDVTRSWGANATENLKSYYISCNRNKKSLTLNLKTEEGREVFYKLIEDTDVLIENFRPGVTKKLQIDYDKLKKINSKLIYTSITGFGPTGPEAKRPGYDLIAQGMGGVMGLTGDKEGKPHKVGVSVADMLAGIFAANGTLSALLQREKTGEGQLVETSLLSTQVALLSFQAQKFLATGESPTRIGNEHPDITPYETFTTQDGFINIGVGTEKFWKNFCDVIGLMELMNDSRFETNSKRLSNRTELVGFIESKTSLFKRDELLKLLSDKAIPCGPINTIQEVFESPQVKHLDMMLDVTHPKEGKMKVVGFPVKFSDTPGQMRLAPPLLGEHNTKILSEYLDIKPTDIENLMKAGVI